MKETSLGALKGAVSAQKNLQGSETEMYVWLAETVEKSVPPMRGAPFICFIPEQSITFFKEKTEKKLS